MISSDLTSLQSELTLKQRMLDVILKIDHARDVADDERELVTAAVSIVCDTFGVEVCLLCLIDSDTNVLEVKALADRVGGIEKANEEALRRMAQAAMGVAGAQQPAVDPALASTGLVHWLTASLRMQADQLGAVLLANRSRPFQPADRSLLEAAVSQLDSAVVHTRTLRELRLERLELRTLYRIDHIRDKGLPFEAMLDAVLAELCRAIPSEVGFIMLFDTAGNRLELKTVTDNDLLRVVEHYQLVHAAALEAMEQGQPVARRYPEGRIQSIICVPLILNDRVIGVFGVINRQGRTEFGRSDRRLLWAIASQIDTAIFEGLQIQKYREVFGRRVGPQVMDRLLSTSDRDLLRGERVIVTSLFSDIRGFTGISERIKPEILVQMLNEHLSALTEIVISYEGTVDKFVGDCVMALYNAPERQADHALRAVKTALEMMKAHHQLMRRWESMGWEAAPIGIGIDTGETIVGNFGSVNRNEYTAISRHVNLASRLCGAAGGDQILISEDTYALIREIAVVRPVPGLHLKGVAEVVDAYEVLGLK